MDNENHRPRGGGRIQWMRPRKTVMGKVDRSVCSSFLINERKTELGGGSRVELKGQELPCGKRSRGEEGKGGC